MKPGDLTYNNTAKSHWHVSSDVEIIGYTPDWIS